MSDFDFSDINLDFLQSTPPRKSNVHINSPLVKPDLHLSHKTEIRSKKQLECAKKIACVDKLLKEIQILKCDKLQLQTQLKDFQKTALDIQKLYTSEKQAHELKTKALQDLQRKYDQADTELVVKSLKCDQFEASLADQKDLPVEYKDLVVKYLRLINKLDGEDGLRNFADRSLVEELKQYCSKTKIKLIFASPKNHKSRSTKIRKEDAATQCELLRESSPQKATPQTKCQGTQCQVELRTQGTQHISTMTTRSTTTSCFISFRNVGTNFPETQTLPAVNDILKEFAPWQNIMPITPLVDLPQISDDVRKTFKTIGTCTWLCNIRRPIDFMPRNKQKRTENTCPTSCKVGSTQGIKQEVTTPSQSPTPISQPNVSSNHSAIGMDSSVQLSQVSVSSPSFHEIWHIFGRMILGLLQTTDSSSSAGIVANSTMTNQEAVNQQQFHTWLRELYDSSVAAATPTNDSQTSTTFPTNEEVNNRCCLQTDQSQQAYTQSVGTSPLIFNMPSLPLTNIARPQARRSIVPDIQNSQEIYVVSTESDYEEDLLHSQNGSKDSALSSCNNTSLSLDDNSFCDSTNTTVDNVSRDAKPQKKKRRVLDEIQELFPQAMLSKSKQKALKRLLKPKKTKKKSLKTITEPPLALQSLVPNKSLALEDVRDDNGFYEETAVDFLKGIFENEVNDQRVQDMDNYYTDADDETLIAQNEKWPPDMDIENIVDLSTGGNYNYATNDNLQTDAETSVDISDAGEHFVHSKSQSVIHPTIGQGEMGDHTYASNTNHLPAQRPKYEGIQETFLFTKPPEKFKNTKYTNKKQLYSSLFGDSDTELDESEAELEDEVYQSVKNTSTFATVDICSVNSDDIKSNAYGSKTEVLCFIPANKLSDFNSSVPSHSEICHILDESKNIPIINNISPNTKDITFNVDNIQYANNISPPQDISTHNMTPILSNAEIPLLLDHMDQEMKKRLDFIIDKQLEKTTQSGVEEMNGALSEEFQSDFEKDFELSSEEDASEIVTTEESESIIEISSGCEVSPIVNTITKKDIDNETITQPTNIDKNSLITQSSRHNINISHYNSIDREGEKIILHNPVNENNLILNVNELETDFESSSDEECARNGQIESTHALDNGQKNMQGVSIIQKRNVEPFLEEECRAEVQVHKPISPKVLPLPQATYLQTQTTVPSLKSIQENITLGISSGDITDIEKIRDVATPTDELMIDEDTSYEEPPFHTPFEIHLKEDVTYDQFQIPENFRSTMKNPLESLKNSQETTCKTKTPDNFSVQNTSDISSLLNSTIYKEILTDSLCPIVDDILRDADNILLKSPATDKKPTRCGRKRKSEYQSDDQTPCKRSERIKAKKNTLEQSPKANKKSLAHVEIGKYTRVNKNNMKLVPTPVSQIKKLPPKNQLRTKELEIEKEDPTVLKIGFFREIEDRLTYNFKDTAKQIGMAEEISFENKELKLEPIKQNHSDTILNENTSKNPPSSIITSTNTTQNTQTSDSDSASDNLSILSNPYIHATQNPQTSDSNSSCDKLSILSNLSIENLTSDRTDTLCDSQTPEKCLVDKGNVIFSYSESPQSPQYENSIESFLNTATFDIPLELSPEYKPQTKQNSLLESLISHYSAEHNNAIVVKNSIEDYPNKRHKNLLTQYHDVLYEYCYNPMHLDSDLQASKVAKKLQQYTIDINLLSRSFCKIAKESEAAPVKESELPSIIQEMPPRHFNQPMQRLFYLLKYLSDVNHDFCPKLLEQIEFQIFNVQQSEKISLYGCLHLTQLYLIACKLQENQLREHPARFFIAKCLYFYTIKAIMMVLEVLMWYPTALPHREEPKYDRSDPLITVIQYSLMCYKYDMDKPELRGKTLISKLRYEYHYEAFKPTVEEVACNLVEKLKSSKFENITFAFSVFCKRLHPKMAEVAILQTHLLPLANEYFNEALLNGSNNYDIRISTLLSIIAFIVKPFPLDWNIEVYLNLFSRFLNAFHCRHVQEAAVCAIMRLQRFGYVNCFNRLRSFKPSYELHTLTQAMFKTFIHRKKLNYLKTIQEQNPINLI